MFEILTDEGFEKKPEKTKCPLSERPKQAALSDQGAGPRPVQEIFQSDLYSPLEKWWHLHEEIPGAKLLFVKIARAQMGLEKA